MRVVEAAREEIAFAGAVQREQAREAVARGACVGIGEQIHLAGEARERSHHGAAGVIFQDELRDKDGVAQIREGVVEALSGVHAAKSGEIGFRVFADSIFRIRHRDTETTE